LTETLKLPSSYHTYELGLWLKYLYEKTAKHELLGGSKLNTFMIEFAKDSMKDTIDKLSTEFPPMFYGAIISSTNDKPCAENVRDFMKEVEDRNTEAICADPLLDFSTGKSFAFYVSLYMNQEEEKKDYLMKVSGLGET